MKRGRLEREGKAERVQGGDGWRGEGEVDSKRNNA